MFYGSMTTPAKDILKEIREIAASGFDFAEITVEPPKAMPQQLLKEKRKIRKTLHDRGLFAVGHTAWFMDLGSLYEKVRRQWVEEAKKAIDTANALGFEKQSFHSYCAGMWDENRETRKQVLENYAESMNALTDYAGESGLKIMLENLIDKNGEIGSYDKISTILRKSPKLLFHLDAGHAFIQGKQALVTKFITRFRNRLEHIHLHDNQGKEDEHLALGKGKIDYEEIAKQLKRISYNKTITLEVFLGDGAYYTTKIYEHVIGMQAKPLTNYPNRNRKLPKPYNKRISIEHVFSRAIEHLGLDNIKVRRVHRVLQHCCLCLTTMLYIALAAVQNNKPWLARSVMQIA